MTDNTKFVFERYEKKYMLHTRQYPSFIQELEHWMQLDAYGLHTISSVYYDTDDYQIIRHSLDKPRYKEKLRLRCYHTPHQTDTVFLELKKKLSGVSYKRRMALTLHQAELYLQQGVRPACNEQILGEIDWFFSRYHPGPKVLLSYDRLAYFCKADPGLRMTIDAGIRWRDNALSLAHGDYGTFLIPPDTRLVEIKTTNALPLWLSSLLSRHALYPVSFSKYGEVYSQFLQPGREVRHAG